MFIMLVYAVSIITWGLVFTKLIKTIIENIKDSVEHPPLLIPLAVASFALVFESIYFGSSAFLYVMGYEDAFFASLQEQKWVGAKLLIAISGLLLVFKMK